MVVAENSVSAWVQLLMLPKAVLRPALRGGASRREQAARATLRRCQRWVEGERTELWAAPQRRPRRAAAEDEEAQFARRQARCLSLAAEGELAVVAKLRSKHPTAPPAAPALAALGPPPQHLVPDIAVEQVGRLPGDFGEEARPGPAASVATISARHWGPPIATRRLPTLPGLWCPTGGGCAPGWRRLARAAQR